MASPSAMFILESVICGHYIYKLDVGYRRRLMVVLSTIDNTVADLGGVRGFGQNPPFRLNPIRLLYKTNKPKHGQRLY